MAQSFSFDIVSQIDLQEVDNAVQQAMKEIRGRFDFKGSKASVAREEHEVRIEAEEEFRLKSVQEILHQKLARRQVPLRGLQYGEIQPAAGSSVRIRASIQQGIPMEKAREIMKMIKGSKVKVQASIQGDQLRVKGAKKDELQRVIELVKARDLDIDLQFVNYR